MTSTLDHAPAAAVQDQPASSPVLTGVLAEFDTPQSVTTAARAVREAGYTRFDAHTPFPFHELDAAVGIGKTRLPWITLSAAFVGAGAALLMQWWMNVESYPFIISGKPIFSLPSDMPVIFACAVLFASIATLLGMFLLNGLPRFSNPLFGSDRFRRATNDRFFIAVEARDHRFNHQAITALLKSSGALHVEDCWANPADKVVPTRIFQAVVVLVALLCIPVAVIARMRVTDSRLPRIHLIQDMDFQPKFKPQSTNALFSDDRAMRPQLVGTVARGELQEDDALYRGLKEDVDLTAASLVPTTPPAGGAAPVDPLDSVPWVTEFPLPLDQKLMQRGQERFNIYCATCHGLAGDGDGLITQRALELEQGTWVKPISFHTDGVRNQPVGRLFNSITNGVRKMPPMGDVIPVEDRWAILLYVRALQRSRNASINDVPADLRPQLQDF